LIYQREYDYAEGTDQGRQHQADRWPQVIAIKRQETTVFACVKRMFYLLGRSLTCF
jgi:hypothetical protein